MFKNLKVGSLVYVEWEDSFGCSSRWEEIPPDLSPGVMICKSAGWIVAKTKRSIVIVPHLAHSDEHGVGDMTIPIAAIVRVKRLNGPERKITSASSCV